MAFAMPLLPTLADRVHFAYHCLPRDSRGEPPSYRLLEREYDLPHATLSKTIMGQRTKHQRVTVPKIAKALRVTMHWLDYGGEYGPIPTGIVPPRPGTKWMRHEDLPGWAEAVAFALREPHPPIPPEAFLAGADMPVYKPLDRVTPEIAIAVSLYAWETSTGAEQAQYSTAKGRSASAGHPLSGKHRAAPSVRQPAAK